jgi:hypothetical protein
MAADHRTTAVAPGTQLRKAWRDGGLFFGAALI